jgi:hypothetical protein
MIGPYRLITTIRRGVFPGTGWVVNARKVWAHGSQVGGIQPCYRTRAEARAASRVYRETEKLPPPAPKGQKMIPKRRFWIVERDDGMRWIEAAPGGGYVATRVRYAATRLREPLASKLAMTWSLYDRPHTWKVVEVKE